MGNDPRDANDGLQCPEVWAAVHDDPAEANRGFVFRRGVAVAFEACREFAQSGEIWIDAGCGAGHLAERLAGLPLRVVAADMDPDMIHLAKRRWSQLPGRGQVFFTQASVMRFPLRDGSVRGVAAASLAGCLPDIEAFLSESHRVLAPGGKFVLTLTNRDSLLRRINNVIRRMESRISRRRFDPRRYRLYKPSEILALLRAGGLDPIKIEFYNYTLNAGPWLAPPASIAARWRREMHPDGAKSRLARNFLVVARKR